tara:strand:- start:21084 stop:21362 length:279 start_codon:yes stop_codon:yes gene_type:complete
MARNSLAGKRNGKSRTAKFYAKNKKSRDKKKAYDKKYHSSTTRRKYRAALNRANKANKKSKKGDKKDMSHTRGGSLILEAQRRNRARNRGKK